MAPDAETERSAETEREGQDTGGRREGDFSQKCRVPVSVSFFLTHRICMWTILMVVFCTPS